MSVLEHFKPYESADMYNAAPHNPLGFLPVWNYFSSEVVFSSIVATCLAVNKQA